MAIRIQRSLQNRIFPVINKKVSLKVNCRWEVPYFWHNADLFMPLVLLVKL